MYACILLLGLHFDFDPMPLIQSRNLYCGDTSVLKFVRFALAYSFHDNHGVRILKIRMLVLQRLGYTSERVFPCLNQGFIAGVLKVLMFDCKFREMEYDWGLHRKTHELVVGFVSGLIMAYNIKDSLSTKFTCLDRQSKSWSIFSETSFSL